MKKLNPFLSTSLLAVLIFATTLLISCEKSETCANKICLNGGTCYMNGGFMNYSGEKTPTCACPSGFEGGECEIESRTKILGNYNLNGTDNLGGVYSNLNTSMTTSALSIIKINLDVIGTFNLLCSMTPSPSDLLKRFTIDTVTISGISYSGNGSCNPRVIGLGSDFEVYYDTLSLSVTKTNGIDTIVYTLSGMRQ